MIAAIAPVDPTRADRERQAAADLDAAVARAAVVLSGSHLYSVVAHAVARHGQPEAR